MQPHELIGISGTMSSGKDTLAELLEREHGYLHISTSDMVRAEARRTYGKDTQDVLHVVANAMRAKHGSGALALRGIEEFQRQQRSTRNRYAGLALTGIRAVGEAQAVKKHGGWLIFIDAPLEDRFKRYRKRLRPGDNLYELGDFMEYEKAELSAKDPNGQNILGVKKLADFTINNNRGLIILENTALELACGTHPSADPKRRW